MSGGWSVRVSTGWPSGTGRRVGIHLAKVLTGERMRWMVGSDHERRPFTVTRGSDVSKAFERHGVQSRRRSVWSSTRMHLAKRWRSRCRTFRAAAWVVTSKATSRSAHHVMVPGRCLRGTRAVDVLDIVGAHRCEIRRKARQNILFLEPFVHSIPCGAKEHKGAAQTV